MKFLKRLAVLEMLTGSNRKIFDRKKLKIRSGGGEKVRMTISLGKEKLSKKEKC